MERGKRSQFLVAFSVSLATLSIGVRSAWSTIVIQLFSTNATVLRVSEEGTSWMIAMTPLGFTCGSLLTRFVSDRYGRRITILASAAPFVLGTNFVILASGEWMLCVATFLWGFGTGMISTVITMYLVEISYKELRASLNVVTRFTYNLGSLLMMCVGPFLPYEVLNYTLLALPLIYFIACWWIPESPYYYLKEGKVAEAKRELTRLRNNNVKAIEEELEIMQNSVNNDMRGSSSAKELFTKKQYRKAVIVAAGLKVTQILTGGVAVQQYMIVIVQESRFSIKPATISIVYGAVNFGVALISSVLVDRVGRRPLLIYSFVGTGLALGVVGTYFFLLNVVRIDHATLSPYGVVTFVGIITSTIISNLGFQSIAGIIPAEIFPLNVKAVAMTSLNILGGLSGFAVARGYQLTKDVLGLSGVFWIFTFVTFSGAVFTYFFVPETRGKSFHEIQVMLQGDLYEANGLQNMHLKEETELTKLNKVKNEENDIP